MYSSKSPIAEIKRWSIWQPLIVEVNRQCKFVKKILNNKKSVIPLKVDDKRCCILANLLKFKLRDDVAL